jgi:hypothetical protein
MCNWRNRALFRFLQVQPPDKRVSTVDNVHAPVEVKIVAVKVVDPETEHYIIRG